MTRTRFAALVVGLPLAALLLTGCSTADAGASALAGDTPSGTAFVAAPDAPTAPLFEGELVDGTAVDARDLWQDRALVIHFTASWCGRCATAEGDLDGLRDRYPGLEVVDVAPREDTAEALRGYVEEAGIRRPTIVDTDGSIWRDYGVAEPSTTVLIDPAGGIVAMWPGGADTDAVADALDTIVAER